MQPGAPKRSLGQNFLVDPNVQRRIVDACGAGAGDPVLEIGPGRGALTTHLIERGVLLTVVELDDVLARELEARFGDSVTVIHADVLSLDLSSRLPDWPSTHVIGNIPYNITSPLLFHLLEAPRPMDLVLMVQAEVAERLTASPGTKAYGASTVGVRSVAEVRRLFAVSRSVFRPVPAVDSAVVRITPRPLPSADRAAAGDLRTLTRAAFGWRRKQLATTLTRHPEYGLDREVVTAVLEEMGLPLTVRPERLTPEQFVTLASRLAKLR